MVISPPELPPFFRLIPTWVDKVDIDYMAQKGAFNLLDKQLLNSLLKAYVNCVHPFMPMIDIHMLLEAVCWGRSDRQVSLLVFQAVLFSAAAYVDLASL
jgi:hypothetical protein